MKITSKAIKYGDDINTDIIIPGKYTKTLIMQELAMHAMEDLDHDFLHKIKTQKIIVAGENFGCGSSREQAPLALKYAGVELIIAKSFARIFFRNAINIGLPVIQSETEFINDEDVISYELGSKYLINESTEKKLKVLPIPEIMTDILISGGLTNYLFINKDYK